MWGAPRQPHPFSVDYMEPLRVDVPPILPPLPPSTPPIMPAATMAPMAAAVREKPKFFDKNGAWRDIAGIIADAIAGAAGGQGMYMPMKAKQKEQESLLQRELAKEEREARRPIREKIGNNYYEFNPADGTSRLLIQGPPETPKDDLTNYLNLGNVPMEERPTYYRRKADAMVAPPMQSVQGFDEQGNPVLRFIPRTPAAPANAPAVGTVRNGYRFNGGDPANPSSWSPVGNGGAGPQTPQTFPQY